MSSADNVTNIRAYSNFDRQKIIDDVGARAFLFLRESAEDLGIPMKDIVAEHMLGLALVMSSVEGHAHTKSLLQHINSCVDNSASV
ncbi:MAG: hypothetical protein JKY66_05745 [Spongiibacteraceae bacterium]|nr:hypothetical protein [Spongiibacteraceae bacterium]